MNLPVEYIPPSKDFLFGPDSLYEHLINELDWYHAGDKVPRKEYYVHEKELPYVYGKGEFAREYQSQPDHWVIAYIRNQLFKRLDVDFDVVFLNLYENQHHHLGWHADDSPEMSDDHPIVTVSLGAEREIWFRRNPQAATAVWVDRLLLENGSAAVMLPGMQNTHQHRIPKHDRQCGPRISLTFRKYVY